MDQEHAVQRVVHTEEFTPRDRAAAILVLVFDQQIEDVVRLTGDQAVVADDLVRVRIGAIEITLPCPLDEPWRELAANPGNDLTAAHPPQQLGLPWLLLPRPPHRRQSPPQPTSSSLQHTRRAARQPSRTHEIGPHRDSGRGARLPPSHNRAPCRRLSGRIQQIRRGGPGQLKAATTRCRRLNRIGGTRHDGSLRLMIPAQRMMSPFGGLLIAR